MATKKRPVERPRETKRQVKAWRGRRAAAVSMLRHLRETAEQHGFDFHAMLRDSGHRPEFPGGLK